MEMEISLQDYMNVMLKGWKVIIPVFLGALVVAAVISFWQPSIYEASVTMFEPSYRLVAEMSIESTDGAQKLYAVLARSAALEAQVQEALKSSLSPVERSPGGLLRMVAVVATGDPALFEIRARHTDPEMAVQIANTWAIQYLEMFDALNGDFVTELGFIREQLAVAERDLESAEQALRTFERQSGLGIAPNRGYGLAPGSGIQDPYAWYGTRGKELEAKSELLANHRVARDNLLIMLRIAQGLGESGGGIDDLPLQLLSVQAIAGRGQLSAELILREADDLDAVMELLQAEEQGLASVIDVLSSEVEELQAELTEDKYEYLLLDHARDGYLEMIDVLSRKAQELEIETGGVRIIGPAVGAVVASPSPWLNVVLAGVSGLLIGILLAFGLEYLRRSQYRPKQG
jgi:uncharacterized protein involved in exopolysaccharide biosynthesis